MQVAIISDIHGNLVSLEAVLTEIEREHVDLMVCLGDVATLGAQPYETVARLQELDCQFIRGNHEDDLLNIPAMEQRNTDPQELLESVKWCREQLTNEQLRFLESFQPTLEIQLDEQTTMLCFHGSPKSNTDTILATTPREELDRYFKDCTAQLLIGGHTHMQMLRRYDYKLVVNPGSVGEPLSRMPFHETTRILPWAEYAIISTQNDCIQVDLRRVPIEIEAVKQASEVSTNPFDWSDSWLKID